MLILCSIVMTAMAIDIETGSMEIGVNLACPPPTAPDALLSEPINKPSDLAGNIVEFPVFTMYKPLPPDEVVALLIRSTNGLIEAPKEPRFSIAKLAYWQNRNSP